MFFTFISVQFHKLYLIYCPFRVPEFTQPSTKSGLPTQSHAPIQNPLEPYSMYNSKVTTQQDTARIQKYNCKNFDVKPYQAVSTVQGFQLTHNQLVVINQLKQIQNGLRDLQNQGLHFKSLGEGKGKIEVNNELGNV